MTLGVNPKTNWDGTGNEAGRPGGQAHYAAVSQGIHQAVGVSYDSDIATRIDPEHFIDDAEGFSSLLGGDGAIGGGFGVLANWNPSAVDGVRAGEF